MRIYDDRGRTEQDFLREYSDKKYPKPSLTADIILLEKNGDGYDVLLVKRRNHPFLDFFALPGGFADPGESIEQTAARELAEETAVQNIPLDLVGVYSKPGRDPRGWVVSCAYMAEISPGTVTVRAGDDAAEASWFNVSFPEGKMVLRQRDLPGEEPVFHLAFDHEKILRDAINAADKNKSSGVIHKQNKENF